MCKIMAFTNSTKLNLNKTTEHVSKALMRSERDGFGYAMQGTKGVFGERAITPKFTSRIGVKHALTLPILERRQDVFGEAGKGVGPAIFHGRTSTNDKGLVNCHPMSRDGWHLIHNGVVTDHGPDYDKYSTNDSEDLLHRLILGIDHVERELTGYYAFAAIDPHGRLHVARDSMATLFMAWVPKYETHVIATTEELIKAFANAMSVTVGPTDKIQDNVYMIFQGTELVYHQSIKPRGFEYREAKHATLSLGREVVIQDETRFNDRGRYADADEAEVEELLTELDGLDDTYVIQTYEGETLTVAEYHRLDEVSKMECSIQREDGTYLDLELVEDVGA